MFRRSCAPVVKKTQQVETKLCACDEAAVSSVLSLDYKLSLNIRNLTRRKSVGEWMDLQLYLYRLTTINLCNLCI